MRRKPLDDPKLIGCGACGIIPGKVLTDEKIFFPGDVHIINLRIDDREKKLVFEIIAEEGITISGIEKRYKKYLENCVFAELFHITPLHDETYEYNTEDKKWYLVAQGGGYA